MTPQKSATPTPFRARTGTILAAAICFVSDGLAVMPPNPPPTRNFDKRRDSAPGPQISAERQQAESELLARLPSTRVDYDPVTGTPAWISRRGLLSKSTEEEVQRTGSLGLAGDDRNRAIKAFLLENAALFGHSPEVLNDALITREFVSQHNGMRTVVWQQQLDDIPVFEGVLIGHITKSGRLVNISSYFLPDIESATGMDRVTRLRFELTPAISSTQAVANALNNVNQEVRQDGNRISSASQLLGEARAHLVWLPMSRQSVRLCWSVQFRSRATDEGFQMLVDAASGEVLIRHNCTDNFSETYFRVYTSDSPAPLTPGWPAPTPMQPGVVPSQLLYSDAGWIAGGDNRTLGNNVIARLWRDLSSNPSAPVQGYSRIFDFSADLNQEPVAYANASVVNLFYWCNWMHDKLYQLGFDEAAGNFQTDNFGRSGVGADPIYAYAQYGADSGLHNNAYFYMPLKADGNIGEIQMYHWNGPSPYRDGGLAAEIILHEYAHGLSHRRVGGGVGLSAWQSKGLGEGWSDFYALALLSQATDDLAGTFTYGAYNVYHFTWEDPSGGPDFVFDENYYYGLRRYPYTVDMTKNPLTLNDIDNRPPPFGADHCASGAPFSPLWLRSGWGSCAGFPAWLAHNMGEVWCVTLWEARKSLIDRYGYAVGNNLALQLVTDGMNLCPPNPTFIQARDALLTADCILTGASNFYELAEAFRKRGMGRDANTSGSFDFPPTAVESFVPFRFGGSWCAE